MFKHFIRNTTAGAALAVAFVGTAQAAATGSPGMEACRAEVEQYYGHPIDLQVIHKRRSAKGVQVKLAARLDQDNAEFLICWLSHEDMSGAGSPHGGQALAARIEPVPVIQ